ncbi:MAG TPA: bifunctional riboflavin kinase/FAD synthetase [Acidobacteriota bacterium]|jgi:riboflavin kinase/FMN adenylyltransferase|nr:bifunctional riboflavin kinase/FAD synthetase [Acidobacteriota bacterium]
MRIVRSLKEITATFPYPILTIGSFDGVHCGHQKILSEVAAKSRQNHGTAAVLTFHPHPQKIISPGDSPRLIQTFEQKAALLDKIGIDLLALIPFTWDLAQLSARDFVVEIIHRKLGIRELHVGANFRFGHNREGDVTLLKQLGEELAIQIVEVSEYYFRKIKVSSTQIRRFLSHGHVEIARRLLGRPFSLTGAVVHGDGLGARIGIPTANLDVSNELIPQTGVYVTSAMIEGKAYQGVTNVGFRPTVAQRTSDRPIVETHLFDFRQDLYEKEVELFFHFRIRAEKKFSGLDELVKQIHKDIDFTRRYFIRANAAVGQRALAVGQ